jgi:hypothetical protein
MFERWTERAEQVAMQAGVSRRGFLGWLGYGAAGLVGVMSGLLAVTSEARPHTCTSNDQCGEQMYCARRGGCRGPGTCQPRPDICTEEFAPVCGCDGQSYPNACYAARAGVNVQHRGPCRIRRP